MNSKNDPSENRPPRQLIAVRGVAEMLGVSVSTVWRLRDQGLLPKAVRVGSCVRWRIGDIQRYIERL
jgi:excisionase family DNA binding protein